MKAMLFTIVMASTLLAQASLLSYEVGDQKNAGVVLNKVAAINDDKGVPTALKMDLLGAGLRNKTVLVVAVKVYVAQLFSDNKAGFSRDANALTSLVQSSSRVALRIDMLRTVSAQTLSDSFKEALAANGYPMDAELTNLMSLIEKSAEGTSGKTITLLLVKDPKDATKTNVYYEDTKGTVQSLVGTAEMSTKLLSIWLGKPADDGLAALKASLLKPVY